MEGVLEFLEVVYDDEIKRRVTPLIHELKNKKSPATFLKNFQTMQYDK